MKPTKPLTNQERVVILQAKTGKSYDHIADLEREHFGSNRLTRMLEYFRTKINPTGSFDNKYDDYLLQIWDDLQTPAGGPGGIGSPIGLLIALTQGQSPPEYIPPVNISSGGLITTVPAITYSQDIT